MENSVCVKYKNIVKYIEVWDEVENNFVFVYF